MFKFSVSEETVEQIKENLSLEIEKKESITSAYEKKCNEFEELENKIKTLEKQNLQFKRDIIRYISSFILYCKLVFYDCHDNKLNQA